MPLRNASIANVSPPIPAPTTMMDMGSSLLPILAVIQSELDQGGTTERFLGVYPMSRNYVVHLKERESVVALYWGDEVDIYVTKGCIVVIESRGGVNES
jgi:hypothetical protein